jgi:arylsulfatase
VWELYYLPDDFSQAHNIAAEHPEKVAELVELFWAEAQRNKVLPILGGFAVFFGMLPPMPTKTRFTFHGDVQNIQTSMIPRIVGRSYAIEAHAHVPEDGAEGVLVAFADFFGGFALWIDAQGYLHHTYQFLGVETYRQSSTRPIPTGDVTLTMLFEADEARPGTGGDVTLLVDGEKVGEGRIPQTISLIFTTYAGMDVGRDNGEVVDLDYEDRAPYAFTGTVDRVVFDLKPRALEEEADLHRAEVQVGVAHGAAG